MDITSLQSDKVKYDNLMLASQQFLRAVGELDTRDSAFSWSERDALLSILHVVSKASLKAQVQIQASQNLTNFILKILKTRDL